VGKLSANKDRDNHVSLILINKGWSVLRIWEHELLKSNRSMLLAKLLFELNKLPVSTEAKAHIENTEIHEDI
jgi:G:T-mismatch repair DNA endonuclease (very short patch repair protein)